MKDALITIYNLLNQLEIKGALNINNLYKSISILESLLMELQKEEDENKQKE